MNESGQTPSPKSTHRRFIVPVLVTTVLALVVVLAGIRPSMVRAASPATRRIRS